MHAFFCAIRTALASSPCAREPFPRRSLCPMASPSPALSLHAAGAAPLPPLVSSGKTERHALGPAQQAHRLSPEHRGDVRVRARSREVLRRRARVRLGRQVSAVVEEEPHHPLDPSLGRGVERRHAVVGFGGNVCLVLQEESRHRVFSRDTCTHREKKNYWHQHARHAILPMEARFQQAKQTRSCRCRV